jgi:hypothetical protein
MMISVITVVVHYEASEVKGMSFKYSSIDSTLQSPKLIGQGKEKVSLIRTP